MGGGETWKVVGWTFCPSLSSRPIRFVPASLATLTLPTGSRGDISHVSLPWGQPQRTVVSNTSLAKVTWESSKKKQTTTTNKQQNRLSIQKKNLQCRSLLFFECENATLTLCSDKTAAIEASVLVSVAAAETFVYNSKWLLLLLLFLQSSSGHSLLDLVTA